MNPLKHTFYQNLHKRYGSLQALKTFLSDDIKAMLWNFRAQWQWKINNLGIVLNVVNKTSGIQLVWRNNETHEALKSRCHY
jgi:hypothetical protein